MDRAAVDRQQICGLRVPSVISTIDHNVLLDPRRQVSRDSVAEWVRIPFNWLVEIGTSD